MPTNEQAPNPIVKLRYADLDDVAESLATAQHHIDAIRHILHGVYPDNFDETRVSDLDDAIVIAGLVSAAAERAAIHIAVLPRRQRH